MKTEQLIIDFESTLNKQDFLPTQWHEEAATNTGLKKKIAQTTNHSKFARSEEERTAVKNLVLV